MLSPFYSRRIHFFFFWAFFLSLFFGHYFWFSISVVCYLSMLYLFRRYSLSQSEHFCVAPTNGRVKKITNQQIEMSLGFFDGLGIYAPVSGVILEQKMNELVIRDHEGEHWRLGFQTNTLGSFVQIFVREKDIVEQGTTLGFVTWGGELTLYIPIKYEILVKEDMILKVGYTTLAR